MSRAIYRLSIDDSEIIKRMNNPIHRVNLRRELSRKHHMAMKAAYRTEQEARDIADAMNAGHPWPWMTVVAGEINPVLVPPEA